ncbi:MAG TPA: serine/threonine-protein kinase [Verrucomicrobiae bacterium]|nr:serine/threonine-protein kinase [Verrucomicrobiae bacterium]
MPDTSQEEILFDAARLLKTAAARAAFLDQACAADPQLRERVEALLLAETEADGFFNAVASRLKSLSVDSTGDTSGTDELTDALGTCIGRYKLLQKIGEGGCGIVYMAEQQEPVHRRVALKIIKLGMDTKSVIARFDAERQALALMDHPNIARVLDAGATETGRPYFMMELVRGVRITDYCDKNQLDMRQRLELFVQVCQAIQHAHQKGVIHRDIKPSNILVTLRDGVPVPKVIDFGIAKAIQGRLTDKTLFTAYEQLIGTPAYMSPEQAEMSDMDVDTRSDIYSLGVLLYELLTGKTPFDARELIKSGVDQMRKTLREVEPQRPSNILTTLHGTELKITAARRHEEAPQLISRLKGDLDWIVMKALEKDRKRRYETANGLAMDIVRYLNNEPVVARPPSRLYRFQKLVRRNKVVFASAAAVVLALVIGLGVSTWLLVQERAARQRAVEAEQKEIALRQQAEQREKITQMTLLISEEKFDEADELSGKVNFTRPSLEAASVLRSLGEWHALRGDYAEAAERFAQLLKVNQMDGWDVDTLDYLECGPLWIELNDKNAYERFRHEAIARFAGTTYPVADRIMKISLLIPADAGVMKSLEPLEAVTLQTFQAANSDTPPDVFRASWQCVSMALFEYRKGNYEESAQWSRRCLSYSEFNAPRTVTAQTILAMACWQLHQPDEARRLLKEARTAVENKFSGELDPGSAPNGFWFDWFFARILVREAAAMIPAN